MLMKGGSVYYYRRFDLDVVLWRFMGFAEWMVVRVMVFSGGGCVCVCVYPTRMG